MALRRLQALDAARNADPNLPDSAPADDPPTGEVPDARPRGEKRPASDEPMSPSKRPAL